RRLIEAAGVVHVAVQNRFALSRIHYWAYRPTGSPSLASRPPSIGYGIGAVVANGALASLTGSGRRRQLEPERRAFFRDAREADPAAVGLDDLARDREPQPHAGDAAGARLAAEELREDARLVLVGNAQPLVLDEDPCDVRVTLARHLDHTSGRRVLDRVRDQVADDLPEPVLIADDGEAVRRYVDDELMVGSPVGG